FSKRIIPKAEALREVVLTKSIINLVPIFFSFSYTFLNFWCQIKLKLTGATILITFILSVFSTMYVSDMLIAGLKLYLIRRN
ncbi:MAG: hypothetical protein RPR91_03770, partial [Colwellia sp.]